ncbi:MAG TPA: hypothetical protein VJ804_13200, partial [Acidimicrobiales bacterium]|nr:hypothetical protein [Acidimicrobiales bacterium]
DAGSVPIGSGLLPGIVDAGFDLGPGTGTGSPGAGSGAGGVDTELVAVPVGRQVEDWDMTGLYRAMLLGGAALFVAGRVVVRTSLRPIRRATDLRQLWRW